MSSPGSAARDRPPPRPAIVLIARSMRARRAARALKGVRRQQSMATAPPIANTLTVGKGNLDRLCTPARAATCAHSLAHRSQRVRSQVGQVLDGLSFDTSPWRACRQCRGESVVVGLGLAVVAEGRTVHHLASSAAITPLAELSCPKAVDTKNLAQFWGSCAT